MLLSQNAKLTQRFGFHCAQMKRHSPKFGPKFVQLRFLSLVITPIFASCSRMVSLFCVPHIRLLCLMQDIHTSNCSPSEWTLRQQTQSILVNCLQNHSSVSTDKLYFMAMVILSIYHTQKCFHPLFL
jgi:hypothetical protein